MEILLFPWQLWGYGDTWLSPVDQINENGSLQTYQQFSSVFKKFLLTMTLLSSIGEGCDDLEILWNVGQGHFGLNFWHYSNFYSRPILKKYLICLPLEIFESSRRYKEH